MKSRQSKKTGTISVILAAGEGSRMESPHLHKVCFPIEGRPAIVRAIETYQQCGIQTHLLVVGNRAEQVMAAAAGAPGVHLFCHQPRPTGTGNAARMAAELLASLDYRDNILLVAGDKVIESEPLQRLQTVFEESGADLAFLAGEIQHFPDSGRIIYGRDNRVRGILEVFDIARVQLLQALERICRERPLTAQEVQAMALGYFRRETKAALALGGLWDAVRSGQPITRNLLKRNFRPGDFEFQVNRRRLEPELVSGLKHVNLSVYLFRAPALYQALEQISRDNAQQEEYLTDTVGVLADAGARLEAVPVVNPHQVMAYNTPAELEKIEAYLASRRRISVREGRKALRPATEWLAMVERPGRELNAALAEIYGSDFPYQEQKRGQLAALLRRYLELFGDEPVVIGRAPGRLNIMGRHIDHQGGHINLIATNRDVFVAAGIRPDRKIRLVNLHPQLFADRAFAIEEIPDGCREKNWLDFVNGPKVTQNLARNGGDWSQYIKAVLARFQARFPDRRLAGMNLAVTGDVPIASGLSSSSALLVAAAEAVAALNRLNLAAEEFVELCGEGEWFVGTRGGSGDHAAMKFARRGQVVQVGFFPLQITDTVPFPEEHCLLIANSHQPARKTAGVRDIFNHRIACYQIGRELLKQAFPHYAPSIEHLRDFNTERLAVDYPTLFRMLKAIPTEITRNEARKHVTDARALACLESHAEHFNRYPVRAVVIFGLAECQRSYLGPNLMRRGQVEEFGRWMSVSHDGDRVVSWNEEGLSRPFTVDYSDPALDRLIREARRDREESLLRRQPGSFSCSTPQLDRLVDLARRQPGVKGAQLSGAGLG
ncbi:MAG TPA: NTP transferase domain-containing protein, partial [bacterium]|nr:NTP transferase domain-containing protein [bacterium]